MQTWTVKELREALSDPRMDEYTVAVYYPEYGGSYVDSVKDLHFEVGYDRQAKVLTIEL